MKKSKKKQKKAREVERRSPKLKKKKEKSLANTSTSGTKRKTSDSKPSHYVDKLELLNEVVQCQKCNQVSDKLAEMFGKMIEGVSHRFSNLQYYDISDDVKQDCHLLLLQKYKNFKAKLNTSCFAFFTTVIFNQMRYQLTKARRHKDHRDHMVNAVIDFMENRKHEFVDTYDEDEYN